MRDVEAEQAERGRRGHWRRAIGVPRWVLAALATYAVAVLIWQLAAMALFPSLAPTSLAKTMASFYLSEVFWKSAAVSIGRIGAGYLIAVVAGVTMGMLVGHAPLLEEIFDPIWGFLRPIAPMAWVPLSVVWLGATETSAIFVIAFAVFFPVALHTLQGVHEGSRIYREAAVTLGAGPRQLFWEVSLPSALPAILTGLRVGMALAWGVLVAAELVVGFIVGSGLGYLMLYHTLFVYSLGRLVAIALAIGAFGLMTDVALRWLANRLAPWRARAKGGS